MGCGSSTTQPTEARSAAAYQQVQQQQLAFNSRIKPRSSQIRAPAPAAIQPTIVEATPAADFDEQRIAAHLAAADAKLGARPQTAATSPSESGAWKALPTVLVLHLLSWIEDVHSILALLSTCKLWRALPKQKLEAMWKARYSNDFEPESLNTGFVSRDGDATTWRRRYRARWRIEQNWARNQYHGKEGKLPIDVMESCSVLSTPLARMLCCGHRLAAVVDLSSRAVLFRFSVATNDRVRLVAIDAYSAATVAIALSNGEVSVWNIGGAKEQLLARVQTNVAWAVALSVRGEHLLIVEGTTVIKRAHIWHFPTATRLHRATIPDDSESQPELTRMHLLSDASSFFAQDERRLALFAVDAQGKLVRKEEMEFPCKFACRADTRAPDGLLIFTARAMLEWRAGQAPKRLHSPPDAKLDAFRDGSIFPRFPCHLISLTDTHPHDGPATRDTGMILVDSRGARVCEVLHSRRRVHLTDYRFAVIFHSLRGYSVLDFAKPRNRKRKPLGNSSYAQLLAKHSEFVQDELATANRRIVGVAD